jgi:hypothetical protein
MPAVGAGTKKKKRKKYLVTTRAARHRTRARAFFPRSRMLRSRASSLEMPRSRASSAFFIFAEEPFIFLTGQSTRTSILTGDFFSKKFFK